MTTKNEKLLQRMVLEGRATEAEMKQLGGLDAVVSVKTAQDAVNYRAFVPDGYKAEQLDERRFKFAFSNEKPDQAGDILKASGWDLKTFKTNPVLLWSHDGNARPPVGTVPKVMKGVPVAGAPGLAGEILMADQGIDPFVDGLTAFVATGVVRATSVGFKFLETKAIKSPEERMRLGLGPFGVFSLKQRLFEISLVSIGMNSDALARECDDMLRKGLVDREQLRAVLDVWPLRPTEHSRIVKELCARTLVDICAAIEQASADDAEAVVEQPPEDPVRAHDNQVGKAAAEQLDAELMQLASDDGGEQVQPPAGLEWKVDPPPEDVVSNVDSITITATCNGGQYTRDWDGTTGGYTPWEFQPIPAQTPGMVELTALPDPALARIEQRVDELAEKLAALDTLSAAVTKQVDVLAQLANTLDRDGGRVPTEGRFTSGGDAEGEPDDQQVVLAALDGAIERTLAHIATATATERPHEDRSPGRGQGKPDQDGRAAPRDHRGVQDRRG